MNCPDPIEELYEIYSEEEDTPRIVELGEDMDMDLGLEDRPMDPYLEL